MRCLHEPKQTSCSLRLHQDKFLSPFLYFIPVKTWVGSCLNAAVTYQRNSLRQVGRGMTSCVANVNQAKRGKVGLNVRGQHQLKWLSGHQTYCFHSSVVHLLQNNHQWVCRASKEASHATFRCRDETLQFFVSGLIIVLLYIYFCVLQCFSQLVNRCSWYTF